MPPLHVLIYARADDENPPSPDAQVDRCRPLAELRGAAEIEVRVDDESAVGDDQPPELKRLWLELEAETPPAWHLLLVDRLDRLTRDPARLAHLCRRLHAHDRGLLTLREQVDLTSPAGRSLLRLFEEIHHWEHRDQGSKTRTRMLAIAKAGDWPVGRTPYGYRRGHGNTLEPDPEQAPAVRRLFRDYASGESITAIARGWDRFSKTALLNMLRNPVYSGKIPFGDDLFPGNHQPLVSDDLFAAVQRRLPGSVDAPRLNARRYPYLLTGLLHCTCGRQMVAHSVQAGGRPYAYYRCPERDCPQNLIAAPELEERILNALPAPALNAADVAGEIARLDAEHRRIATESTARLAALAEQLAASQATCDTLFRSLATGLLEPDNADALNHRLRQQRAEIARLEQTRDDLLAARQTASERLAEAARLLRELATLHAQLARQSHDPDLRRAYLAAHLDRIDIRPDQHLVLHPNLGPAIVLPPIG